VEGGHAAIYNTPRYNRFRQLLAALSPENGVAGSVVAIFILAVLGMGLVKNNSSRPPIARKC
jgi:hypothetical protein